MLMQMHAPPTVDSARPPFWSEHDVLGTGEDTIKKKICNSKFKPHDGEADKPGKEITAWFKKAGS